MKVLVWAASISALLAIAKGAVFAWTGSVVVLASFLDSLVDTFLSFFNFKMSSLARGRADRQHPYGHGGFEVMTSLIQGMLIAGSGLLVIFQSLDRVFSPRSIENLNVSRLPLALAVMGVSAVVALLISLMLDRSRSSLASGNMRSLSLNADHAHYAGDFLQNLVTIAGVAAAWWWQNPWADVAAGFVAGAMLIKTSIPILRDSVRDIMNTEFDPELRAQVEALVRDSGIPEVRGMHRLRTRTLGPNRFVDFHLKLPNQIPLVEAHAIGYRIESLLVEAIPGVDVLLHLDPEAEPDDEFD